jgi:hypothetical protein
MIKPSPIPSPTRKTKQKHKEYHPSDSHATMDLTWIYKLPEEILRQIIAYTYSPQSPLLMRDIRHYHASKRDVLFIYRQTWKFMTQNEPPKEKQWLVNDIMLYLLQYETSPDDDHLQFYYDYFMRICCVNTKAQVKTYTKRIEDRPIDSKVNILWGLLTEEERNHLLQEHTYFYDEIAHDPSHP